MANPAKKPTKSVKVQFTTIDRYLVAALLSNGVAPTVVTKAKNGTCHYAYDRTQRATRLLDRYKRRSLKVNMDYFDRVCEMNYEPYDWE